MKEYLREFRNDGEYIIDGDQVILAKYTGDSEEVTLQSDVTQIGYRAFANNSKMSKITLPSNVWKIQSGAFSNCTKLSTIAGDNLNGVHYIGQAAFQGCTAFKRTDTVYYKILPHNLICHNMTYVVGELFTYDRMLKLCKNGYHACRAPLDVFNYLYHGDLSLYLIFRCEIPEDAKILFADSSWDSKVCTNKIKLLQNPGEDPDSGLSVSELFEAASIE